MINLSDKNIRERKFHDKLHSNSKSRFENIFYKAIINAWQDFYDHLNIKVKDSNILDYGCGVGPVIEKVLKFNPNKITGIDISEVSIVKAKEKFHNHDTKVELFVDNCENTKFNDNKFDLVYGLGILHHLQISKCVNEISRILKSDGEMIFIEPLGTNPLINLYRALTPGSRSLDEHPLINKDFEIIKSKFKNVNLKYYGLLTLLFFPVYRSENSKTFKTLIKLDQFLFKMNFFKYFAWSVLIIAKKN